MAEFFHVEDNVGEPMKCLVGGRGVASTEFPLNSKFGNVFENIHGLKKMRDNVTGLNLNSYIEITKKILSLKISELILEDEADQQSEKLFSKKEYQ